MKKIITLFLFVAMTNITFGQDSTYLQAKTILSYLGYNFNQEQTFNDFTKEVDNQKIFIEEQRDSFLVLLTDDAYLNLEKKLVLPLIGSTQRIDISRFYHFFEQPLGKKILEYSPNISDLYQPRMTWAPPTSFLRKFTLEEQKIMEKYFEYFSLVATPIPLLKERIDQNFKYWKKGIIYNAFQSVKNKNKYLYYRKAVGAKEFYQGKFIFHEESIEIVDTDTPFPPPPPPMIWEIKGDILQPLNVENAPPLPPAKIIWLTDCRYTLAISDSDIERAKQMDPEDIDNLNLYHVFEIKDNIMRVVTADGIYAYEKIE